ncbi:YraN family protein [Phaeacidiphilus oryzae]|uniref:YraN family protein n=1 Tax=Phaeacidiphilus oryzae TaxID=348818 RepID=UPI00055E0154|nr:YraN family protein [Phaeacidiphilus oryzae]
MTAARTAALGRYGEDVAARYLSQSGMRVLERNWRCRAGELDIIALDGETIAVCEVKTRTEHGIQEPAEAITPAKAERLVVLAERWASERWPEPLPMGGIRIDVLCVLHGGAGPARVRHLRGAVG